MNKTEQLERMVEALDALCQISELFDEEERDCAQVVELVRTALAAHDAQRHALWAESQSLRNELDEATNGWWHSVSDDTAYAHPFGTIRQCCGCGCLVAGGPTACVRCAEAETAKPASAAAEWVRGEM